MNDVRDDSIVGAVQFLGMVWYFLVQLNLLCFIFHMAVQFDGLQHSLRVAEGEPFVGEYFTLVPIAFILSVLAIPRLRPHFGLLATLIVLYTLLGLSMGTVASLVLSGRGDLFVCSGFLLVVTVLSTGSLVGIPLSFFSLKLKQLAGK